MIVDVEGKPDADRTISVSGPRTRIGASSLVRLHCPHILFLLLRSRLSITTVFIQLDMGPVPPELRTPRTLVNPDFFRKMKRGSVYVEDGSVKVFLVSDILTKNSSKYSQFLSSAVVQLHNWYRISLLTPITHSVGHRSKMCCSVCILTS